MLETQTVLVQRSHLTELSGFEDEKADAVGTEFICLCTNKLSLVAPMLS